MNRKTKVILISGILSLIGIISLFELGYICILEEKPTNYDLKYNFNKGDYFIYEILYSTEIPKNTIRAPIHIETVVSDISEDNISMNVTSTSTADGNKKKSYNMTLTTHGKTIKSDFNGQIIPEIQLELPNMLFYPENGIQKDESWSASFAKEGNFTSEGMPVGYDVSGTKRYTCLGSKIVSVKAGNFDCVGIKCDANFTLNEAIETANGTVYTTTTGETSGENWVDLRGGFLVKSTYDVNKIIKIDFSETYKKTGFGVFYRETPIDYQTVSELLERRKV